MWIIVGAVSMNEPWIGCRSLTMASSCRIWGEMYFVHFETLVGFSHVHINMLLPGCLLDSILSNTNHKV